MIKGFPSQQKLSSEQKYNTVSPLGSDKHGIDVAPKAIFPTTGTPLAIVSADFSETIVNGLKVQKQLIEITGHSARIGDVLRFDSGPLQSVEAPVIQIIDANTLAIPFKVNSADAIASTCLLMRYVTLTLDSSGSLSVGSNPAEYVLDGVDTQVEEDTANSANNRALPTQTFVDVDGNQEPLFRDTANEANTVAMPTKLYYERDGVNEPVLLDTATPANTRSIPVTLVDVTGVPATINVTTGDLNVETSHDGASHTWDSTRIGDGTNLMAVNASLEAQVRDDDANTTLSSIDGKDFATQTTLAALLTELQLKADLTETQPVSAASLPLPTGAATEATLSSIDGKLPATLGQKASSASLAAVLSTEQEAILSAIQTAVESSDSGLSVVDQLDTPLLDASSTNIPASGGGFLEVVASTAADVKKLDVIDDIGEFIGVYTGAAASEALHCVTKLGGGELEVNIPSGTRISLRNMKNAAITTGNMAINLLG